jgi:hypothetical protein
VLECNLLLCDGDVGLGVMTMKSIIILVYVLMIKPKLTFYLIFTKTSSTY